MPGEDFPSAALIERSSRALRRPQLRRVYMEMACASPIYLSRAPNDSSGLAEWSTGAFANSTCTGSQTGLLLAGCGNFVGVIDPVVSRCSQAVCAVATCRVQHPLAFALARHCSQPATPVAMVGASFRDDGTKSITCIFAVMSICFAGRKNAPARAPSRRRRGGNSLGEASAAIRDWSRRLVCFVRKRAICRVGRS